MQGRQHCKKWHRNSPGSQRQKGSPLAAGTRASLTDAVRQTVPPNPGSSKTKRLPKAREMKRCLYLIRSIVLLSPPKAHLGVAGGLRGAGMGPTAQSFSGGPKSGATQGSELVFFPLQRVTGSFLLPGIELSPAFLHEA